MATASPPTPSAAPQPGGSSRAAARVRSSSNRGRMLAVGALAIVVLIVAYIVFSGGGGSDYKLVFAEADQLVRGDQVQVGGVPVGSIKDIELTHDFKARITIQVNSSLTPLHEGTTAQIRVPSLSSVANRYIALTPGANSNRELAGGATIQTGPTSQAVDLDQLFNVFNPKTRKGLQEVFQGSAEQYAGAGPAFKQSTRYFGPSLAATDHLFSELVRDQSTFTSFLVESSKAVTTIGARSEDLTNLIENTGKTFQAVGSQQANLARGLRQLPITLNHGNRTFADLPSTLSALKQLVDVSKPNTKTLAGFFEKLHPLVTEGTPVVGNLSSAFSRPGAGNDLTDAVNAIPALARVLSTSSPATVTALKEAVPITAFFGPYSPDLDGFIRDFGEGSAYYDANGHYARGNPVFDSFTLGAGNRLTPATPQQGLEPLKTLQLRRCPGGGTQPAADGSSPFVDNGSLSCDPSQVP